MPTFNLNIEDLEEQIKNYLDQDKILDHLRNTLIREEEHLNEIAYALAQKVISETKIRSKSFTITLSFGDKDYSIYIEGNMVEDITLTQPKPSTRPRSPSQE